MPVVLIVFCLPPFHFFSLSIAFLMCFFMKLVCSASPSRLSSLSLSLCHFLPFWVSPLLPWFPRARSLFCAFAPVPLCSAVFSYRISQLSFPLDERPSTSHGSDLRGRHFGGGNRKGVSSGVHPGHGPPSLGGHTPSFTLG